MTSQGGAGRPLMPGVGAGMHLTARQAEILQLAAAGLAAKQIARRLGISVRTVQHHFSSMRRRTGARSVGELVAHAVVAGILKAEPANPGLASERPFYNTSAVGGADDADGGQSPYEKCVDKLECSPVLTEPFYAQSAVTMLQPSRAEACPMLRSGILAGKLVGYARVSITGQALDRQIQALRNAGCIEVFADQTSGRTGGRPALEACLDYLQPGDILVVPSLVGLSGSLHDLIALVARLRRHDFGFRSLHEALDTTTPDGRVVFHVFAALAEFIRELIAYGSREGIQAARIHGVRRGRPPAMNPEQIRHAGDLLASPGNTVSSIARLLGVSRSTIYKHVPELARGTGSPSDEPSH
jgi:DNA invertase Pin-like site-specific DNA recombinase